MVSGRRRVEPIPVSMNAAKSSRLGEGHVNTCGQKKIESGRRNVHVLHELVRATDILELREADLCDDGAKLAARRADTVCSRAVARRENFTRDDKSCGVGAKVLEEVGEAVEEDEGLGVRGGAGELVVAKAEDDEEDGEHDEAHELDGLAAPAVNKQEGDPVSGDQTSSGENEVANADVVQVVVHAANGTSSGGSPEADGGKDDRAVETQTVKCHLFTQMVSLQYN